MNANEKHQLVALTAIWSGKRCDNSGWTPPYEAASNNGWSPRIHQLIIATWRTSHFCTRGGDPRLKRSLNRHLLKIIGLGPLRLKALLVASSCPTLKTNHRSHPTTYLPPWASLLPWAQNHTVVSLQVTIQLTSSLVSDKSHCSYEICPAESEGNYYINPQELFFLSTLEVTSTPSSSFQPIAITLIPLLHTSFKKETRWKSSRLLSPSSSFQPQSSLRLGDAASKPTAGEATVSVWTTKYAGTNGMEHLIRATRDYGHVHLIPTTSWLVWSSHVQGWAQVPSACGEMLAAPYRDVCYSLFSFLFLFSFFLFLLITHPAVHLLIYDNMLTPSRDSSGLPGWKWFCLLQPPLD